MYSSILRCVSGASYGSIAFFSSINLSFANNITSHFDYIILYAQIKINMKDISMKSNHFNFKLLFASTLAILYLIYSAVLSPIYTIICSDVILLESYLPYILEILLEICQLLIWAHLISSMLRAVKTKELTFYIIFTIIFIGILKINRKSYTIIQIQFII